MSGTDEIGRKEIKRMQAPHYKIALRKEEMYKIVRKNICAINWSLISWLFDHDNQFDVWFPTKLTLESWTRVWILSQLALMVCLVEREEIEGEEIVGKEKKRREISEK